MSLTCTYTTTSSDTPISVTYETYSDLKTNLTQNSSYKSILKTIVLSGSGSDTSTTNLFRNCSKLTSINVTNLDTSNITDMSYMFYSCHDLVTLNISNFNTTNVTTMYNMFYGCQTLTTLDLSNFNTSNLTNTSLMFRICTALTTIYCNDDWNTSTLTTSSNIFYGCTSLIGAISYDSSKVNKNYANPTSGYFTRISTSKPVYFNGTQCSKVYMNGTELSSMSFNGTQLF